MNAIHNLHPSKSSLMIAYNRARLSHAFEPGRLNRAFGLAQSSGVVYLPDGDVEVSGGDTFHIISAKHVCDCEDFRRCAPPVVGFSQGYLKPVRHVACKHVICRMLLKRAWDMDTVEKN